MRKTLNVQHIKLSTKLVFVITKLISRDLYASFCCVRSHGPTGRRAVARLCVEQRPPGLSRIGESGVETQCVKPQVASVSGTRIGCQKAGQNVSPRVHLLRSKDDHPKGELVRRKEILLERGSANCWWSAFRQFSTDSLDLNGSCWARVEQNARAWRAEAVKQIQPRFWEPDIRVRNVSRVVQCKTGVIVAFWRIASTSIRSFESAESNPPPTAQKCARSVAHRGNRRVVRGGIIYWHGLRREPFLGVRLFEDWGVQPFSGDSHSSRASKVSRAALRISSSLSVFACSIRNALKSDQRWMTSPS